MKKYINGYNETNSGKVRMLHITSKSKLQIILNNGLKPRDREGNIYLFMDAPFLNSTRTINSTVRDYIAYNELFMGEGEEAILLTIDITDQWEKKEVWREICDEPTQENQFVIKEAVPASKIVCYETFRVTDPLKNVRHSNNKIQKAYQKIRHDRSLFKRTLINLFDESVAC